MTPDRWTLIANPAAGGGRCRRLAEACARYLARDGVDVALSFTERRGHATQLAAAAVDAGHGTVVVCGGDGTVAEALPALAGGEAVLGLLPFGTANDLARALHVPRTRRRAQRLLLEGQPRAVDLGRCGERWFATVATFGFDAEVTHAHTENPLPLPGTAGYLYAALRHLRAYRPPRVRIHGDFGELEQTVFLVATANTRSYGGGVRIAPDADPCDGRFDLCVIDGDLSTRAVLSTLPRAYWGGHLRSGAVRLLRSKSVHLEPLDGPRPMYADGEHLTQAPATLYVERRALRVIQPPAPAAATSYRVVPGGADP